MVVSYASHAPWSQEGNFIFLFTLLWRYLTENTFVVIMFFLALGNKAIRHIKTVMTTDLNYLYLRLLAFPHQLNNTFVFEVISCCADKERDGSRRTVRHKIWDVADVQDFARQFDKVWHFWRILMKRYFYPPLIGGITASSSPE